MDLNFFVSVSGFLPLSDKYLVRGCQRWPHNLTGCWSVLTCGYSKVDLYLCTISGGMACIRNIWWERLCEGVRTGFLKEPRHQFISYLKRNPSLSSRIASKLMYSVDYYFILFLCRTLKRKIDDLAKWFWVQRVYAYV